MKKRQCAARLLLRVPNGGARPACSTWAVSFQHCLRRRRRRVSTNEKETVRSTAAFASAHRGRTPRVLHRANIPTPRRACTSAGIRKKIEQRHRRKAFLRVLIGGARSACSTGAVSFPHCLRHRRRRVSTNEKETVRSTAAFASAERGRTLRVLHRHCAGRARAKIKRPDGAMPDRNNTNQPQSNSFRRFCTAETCQYVNYCLRSARAKSSENLLL